MDSVGGQATGTEAMELGPTDRDVGFGPATVERAYPAEATGAVSISTEVFDRTAACSGTREALDG